MRLTRISKVLIGVAALGVGGFVQATTGQASDQGTKATVNLVPATESKLELTQAPSVTFNGEIKDQQAISGLVADTVTGSLKVLNTGNTAGWTVNVAVGDFKNTDSSSTAPALKGVVLHFTPGSVNNLDDSVSSAPVGLGAVLKDTTPQPIFKADAGNGIGTWEQKHSADNITIDVPNGNEPGSYQADLTWTLANGPS